MFLPTNQAKKELLIYCKDQQFAVTLAVTLADVVA
jgi:hypothetical protein